MAPAPHGGARAAQLADLIRDNLAGWIQRDQAGSFVTITQVTLNPERTVATAWLRCFPTEKTETVLSNARKELPRYRQALAKLLSRRAIPELRLKADFSEEDANTIASLLHPDH